jgi:hypothetical protein
MCYINVGNRMLVPHNDTLNELRQLSEAISLIPLK